MTPYLSSQTLKIYLSVQIVAFSLYFDNQPYHQDYLLLLEN